MAKPVKNNPNTEADPETGEGDVKPTKTKREKKEKAPAEPAFAFGVKDLAEALGTQGTSVRVRLRNAGVEKAGKTYGWNTKEEFDAVLAQLAPKVREPKAKKSKKEKAEVEETEDGDDE